VFPQVKKAIRDAGRRLVVITDPHIGVRKESKVY